MLLVLAITGGVDGIDRAVLRAGLVHAHPWLGDLSNSVIDVFSPLVDAIIFVLGLAVIHRKDPRRRLELWAAAVTAAAASLIVVVSKVAVGRPAPYPPVPAVAGRSFPSGHTAATLTVYGLLALLVVARRPEWKVRALAAVMVATTLVAAAMVYVGAHWLSDTVASVLLCAGLLILFDGQLRPVATKKPPDPSPPAEVSRPGVAAAERADGG